MGEDERLTFRSFSCIDFPESAWSWPGWGRMWTLWKLRPKTNLGYRPRFGRYLSPKDTFSRCEMWMRWLFAYLFVFRWVFGKCSSGRRVALSYGGGKGRDLLIGNELDNDRVECLILISSAKRLYYVWYLYLLYSNVYAYPWKRGINLKMTYCETHHLWVHTRNIIIDNVKGSHRKNIFFFFRNTFMQISDNVWYEPSPKKNHLDRIEKETKKSQTIQ